jgi:pimeloyl-ACP methyl ester carboxylesterase
MLGLPACAILAAVAHKTLTLSGGNTLEYIVAGSGRNLLLYHHGTPAAGVIPKELSAAAETHDFTIAQLVRPGYGKSTRHAGRTVADVVPLVHALADELGYGRFVTVGWSGGGPHALATAALSGGRCVGALCLAGVAPFDAADLDFLAGMGQDNIDEFGAALAGSAQLEAYLTAAAEGLREVTGEDLNAAMGSLLPEVDQLHLAGAAGDELAEELRFSVANGIWGWFDDDAAFTQPWGFDLPAMAGTGSLVEIWQGTDDLMVPFAHGEWLAANVPQAKAYLLSGEGHLSLAAQAFDGAVSRFAAALAE